MGREGNTEGEEVEISNIKYVLKCHVYLIYIIYKYIYMVCMKYDSWSDKASFPNH